LPLALMSVVRSALDCFTNHRLLAGMHNNLCCRNQRPKTSSRLVVLVRLLENALDDLVDAF